MHELVAAFSSSVYLNSYFYFFIFAAIIMLVTTIFTLLLSLQEGTSNYFKGLMLILCYLIVAASFFVHVDPKSGEFTDNILPRVIV
jgi:Ca2+/H+ antiporter